MDKISKEQVCKLRQGVQDEHNIRKTAAIDLCAKALHTSRRSWQQWERGEARMHPAFWELAQIKLKTR